MAPRDGASADDAVAGVGPGDDYDDRIDPPSAPRGLVRFYPHSCWHA